MERYPLDNFLFTVKPANRRTHEHLHTLSEFLNIPTSIVTRPVDARPIPIGSRYSFRRLRDAMEAELGRNGRGFEFIVPSPSQAALRFQVYDEASFSRFVSVLGANVSKNKLHLASPTSEAQLIPLDSRNSPTLEATAATPVAPSVAPNAPEPQAREEDTAPQGQGPDAPETIVIDDDEDSNPEADGILGYLRKQNLITGLKARAFAWTFNIADAERIDMSTTWAVPGMKSPASMAQCAFIYELCRRLRADASLQGIYNADGVGCGKTFTTLMLLVLKRLARLTRQHINDHPEEHYSTGAKSLAAGGRCAFTHRIGISCVCEKKSILAVLLERLPDSYSVVTAPAAILSVWSDHYNHFVKPAFDEPEFPFCGERVMHGYVWNEKTSLSPLGSSPTLAHESFLVQPEVPHTTKSRPRRVNKAPDSDRWSMDELSAALASAPTPEAMPFKRHRTFGQDHLISLIIVGRERLSLFASPAAHGEQDSAKVWVAANRQVLVVKSFLLDFSVIICDEAHEYKGRDSKIFKALHGFWARKARLNQRSPFAVFLSATPAVRDLSDLETASSIINLNNGQHARVMSALRHADKHAKDSDSAEYKGAIEAACKAVERWMVSRAGYSRMLDKGYKISESHPSPKVIVKPFGIPDELQQPLQATIEHVRGGILEKTGTVDPASIDRVIATVNGADLMWKVGPVPGLQACVQADPTFPYSGGRVEEDINAYDDAERRGSSAYLRKLNLLTRNDDMFPAMSSIVREASRGRVADRPKHAASREPLHILLLTQYPCNAAAAYVYLRETCAGVADVHCLLSNITPTERARRLAELRMSSQGRSVREGGKSILFITTFRLGGFGLNDFVFCNVMIQLGEPQTEASLIQATGRVARPGQTKKTFRFYLKREGSDSEELLRIRNDRRVGLCHENVRHLRLFQGLGFR